jgi:uncharacterized hydrophobic protein (TIGR00271 family)
VLHLRILSPTALTDEVVDVLDTDPAVSGLAVVRGAAIRPPGDLVMADIAREGANHIVERLRATRVHREGSIEIDPVPTYMSQAGFDAEMNTPGSSADAVVWAEVAQRSYDESELNWTFLSFLTLATVIASIAIVLDSQILIIGAMVLGPEFGPIAALGVALVKRRFVLFGLAARTLVIGFVVAIAIATLLALAGRGLGWITVDDVTGPRPDTDFIYAPDKWSFIVAVIAAAAGVLSLTSARIGGLTGVFISVTTVPAAGFAAVAVVLADWVRAGSSLLQLVINVAGVVLAGLVVLLVVRASRHRRGLPESLPSTPGAR